MKAVLAKTANEPFRESSFKPNGPPDRAGDQTEARRTMPTGRPSRQLRGGLCGWQLLAFLQNILSVTLELRDRDILDEVANFRNTPFDIIVTPVDREVVSGATTRAAPIDISI